MPFKPQAESLWHVDNLNDGGEGGKKPQIKTPEVGPPGDLTKPLFAEFRFTRSAGLFPHTCSHSASLTAVVFSEAPTPRLSYFSVFPPALL